jgi:hypothetical protein
MDKLFEECLQQLPAAIRQNEKKLWTHIKKHFVSRTWFHGKKHKYYFEVIPKKYIELNEKELWGQMIDCGLYYKPTSKPNPHDSKSRNAEKEEKQARALSAPKTVQFMAEVRTKHYLDWVLPEVAGRRTGPVKLGNKQCLVLLGPEEIEPIKGDPSYVYNIIHTLIGWDQGQEDHFLASLQRARKIFRTGEYRPMQSWIFGGAPGDGKTLLATAIIAACFGGRHRIADATAYFTGVTQFNAELGWFELWLVDDRGEIKRIDHIIYDNRMKKISSAPDVRIEAKGVDAVNAACLFRQVVVCFNPDSPHGIQLLPTLSEDMKGKVQIFLTHHADRPLGENQYAELEKEIKKSMPAFLYWLEKEYRANPAVLEGEGNGDRYQIKAYHNPILVARINEQSKTTHLRRLILEWMNEYKRDWEGYATKLFNELNQATNVSSTFKSMFQSVNSLGYYLSDLAARYPDQFVKTHDEYGSKYFIPYVTVSKSTTSNVINAKFQG